MDIDFTGVSAVQIPEGNVTKITVKDTGVVKWEKILGTPIGDLAIGSSVWFNVDGTLKEWIVVHQGIPSSVYDSSCNGTWLLMKEAPSTTVNYDADANGDSGSYDISDVHNYLNDTVANQFDSGVKDAIKRVKIPYTKVESIWDRSVLQGASGLTTKLFLLSFVETGLSVDSVDSSNVTVEGEVLEYFKNASDEKRIAYTPEGTAITWMLRTPSQYSNSWNPRVWRVSASGVAAEVLTTTLGRPRSACVMDSETLVDGGGNIIV